MPALCILSEYLTKNYDIDEHSKGRSPARADKSNSNDRKLFNFQNNETCLGIISVSTALLSGMRFTSICSNIASSRFLLAPEACGFGLGLTTSTSVPTGQDSAKKIQ